MSAPGELEYVPIGTNQHITSKKKKKKICTRTLSATLFSCSRFFGRFLSSRRSSVLFSGLPVL